MVMTFGLVSRDSQSLFIEWNWTKKQQKGLRQQEEEAGQITAVSTKGFPSSNAARQGMSQCPDGIPDTESYKVLTGEEAEDGSPWAQNLAEGKTLGTSGREASKTPAVIWVTLIRVIEFGLIILNINEFISKFR